MFEKTMPFIFVFILILLCSAFNDLEDIVKNEKYYCKMVEIWENEREENVPKEMRNGWPPFDHSIKCEKN